ncbi:hypothetical protein [Helicobacter fennelliae]|uniref:hypothetical protein n=1 Tax=Helicobacter fennelliae TaxID=215 RepID=UPI000DD4C516|nr:hypothetical protein [Helicobacter fennelliae]
MSAIPKYFANKFSNDELEFNIWKGRQVQKQEPIVPLLITQNSNISTQNTTKAREKKRKKIKKC